MPHMLPQAGHVLAGVVAFVCKPLLEQFVCEHAGLWESIHPFLNLNVYPSIVDHAVEVVV